MRQYSIHLVSNLLQKANLKLIKKKIEKLTQLMIKARDRCMQLVPLKSILSATIIQKKYCISLKL